MGKTNVTYKIKPAQYKSLNPTTNLQSNGAKVKPTKNNQNQNKPKHTTQERKKKEEWWPSSTQHTRASVFNAN